MSKKTIRKKKMMIAIGIIIVLFITSFKMSPSSLGGGKQTTTAGEHISQLVETLIGRFFFLGKKNLNNDVISLMSLYGGNNSPIAVKADNMLNEYISDPGGC